MRLREEEGCFEPKVSIQEMSYPFVAKVSMNVVTSDTVDIPSPWTEYKSGTTSGSASTLLIDFYEGGFIGVVEVGDVVWNTTDNTISTVREIVDDNTLSLYDAIMGTFETYRIFRRNSGDSPFIWVSCNNATVDVTVLTDSGEQVLFDTISQDTILPVRVKRVLSTGTTISTFGQIVALW